VLPRSGLVLFDTADCHFSNPPPFNESVIALRVSDGTMGWVFRPSRPDNLCDTDFGATVNAGLGRGGKAVFTGVGSKDGTYYSLDPRTGALRWSANVVFGGFSGGFIGTAAYDGTRVIGSTALGDFGRFERGGSVLCDPSNPRDVAIQEPSVHAFDASSGKVLWEVKQAQSFGPTTLAGGMTFNGVALSNVVEARDAATGALLVSLPLGPAPCWSGIATAGNAIVFGTGSSNVGSQDGVAAYTPGGQPPSVPVS
jgi:outer membrane protein assembly factor BamB